MRDKANKFKVGDKVKIEALEATRQSFGVVEGMYDIGSIAVIRDIDDCGLVELTGCECGYHIYDLKLIKSVAEINTSQNESIKKTLYSPLTVQQAGDHYKKKGIQPIEYGLANNLSFPQVNVVKYITRHEDKNGLDDLAKSIHYHFFEALRVYGEDGTHELRNKVLSLLGIEQGVFK